MRVESRADKIIRTSFTCEKKEGRKEEGKGHTQHSLVVVSTYLN